MATPSRIMSQITQAEIFKHRYTLEGYKLSYGTITEVAPVFLKLTDKDGIVGWGEANPQQPFTDESSDDVFRVLKENLLPLILRQESPGPQLVDDMLDQVHPAKHLMAKGTITIALLDIQGKRLGQTVAGLLGTPIRRSLQLSYPLNNGSAEDDIAFVDEKLKEGYVDYMLKMGTSPIAEEIKRVATLEARYGDKVKFKADANTGWTRDEAAEFIAGVEDTHLAFIEQPIAKSDIDGLAGLAGRTKQFISVDESLTNMSSAEEIITKRAASIFSLKTTKNGGPLRTKALAELAKQHGIKCFSNSMLEGGIVQAASLHLAVTLTNLLEIGHSFRSVLRLGGDVTDFDKYISNAVVHLPEGPGLGIEVDEAKVRREALASCVVR